MLLLCLVSCAMRVDLGFVGVSVLAVASGLIVLICLCYCLLV